ncbi:DUF3558 domain-containing protein [Nocardia alni]|uniref:DUF3558 domain-containing protein n=1 Tax=Nocardia alni TaxID=2815723 RepID=UPI001C221430|nr:DUF3558 domain-containing protein [Nocardia alni]
MLLIVGCNSGGSAKSTGGATSTTAAMASDVPTGYDPCTQVPQNVLDSLQLTMKIPRQQDAPDGTMWRGCQWASADEYSIAIWVTNATLDNVRSKHYQGTQDLTISGRNAVSSRQVPDHPDQQCTVDVAIKGGSLEFFLSNPAPGNSGTKNACDLAQQAAEKVVPTLPSTV